MDFASGGDSKVELVRFSYQEVLAATLHQDEKIGRLLAAIAFLSTGAIAVVVRGDVASTFFDGHVNLRIAGQPSEGYPLVLWYAVPFFSLILVSVLLLASALGTPLRLPGDKDKSGELPDSLIFFTSIAKRQRKEWVEQWDDKDADDLSRMHFENLASETHNLAERALVKYGRTREATTAFSLSLIFLIDALLAYFFAATLGEGGRVEVNIVLCAGIGMANVAFLGVLLYSKYMHELRSQSFLERAQSGHVESGEDDQNDEAITNFAKVQSIGILWATGAAVIMIAAVSTVLPIVPSLLFAAAVVGICLAGFIYTRRFRTRVSAHEPTDQGWMATIRSARFIVLVITPSTILGFAIVVGGLLPLYLSAGPAAYVAGTGMVRNWIERGTKTYPRLPTNILKVLRDGSSVRETSGEEVK